MDKNFNQNLKPISLQLHSVREDLKKDLPGTMKKISAIGYRLVQPAGFFNLAPREFKKIANDFGLEIITSHSPKARVADLNAAIDQAGELELDMLMFGCLQEEFQDLDTIKRVAEQVNHTAVRLKKAGLGLYMHNHYWEFERISGRLKYDIFAELCPTVKFEIDAYWAANFGAEDPAAMVRRFAGRIMLLHIKDGSLVKGAPMTAVGAGRLDIPAIIAATPEQNREVIVELDSCATDMFMAVKASFDYLTGNQLAYAGK